MNLSSSLKVSNSNESEFLTKSFILIWPSAPFFFCFTSLFFWVFFSLSLTLSLTAHQIRLAIRNDPNVEPIRNIPTPNPFATIPFAEPIRDDPHSWRIVHPCCQIVRRTRHFCLLIVTFAYRRRFCSPSLHLLVVVVFARRRRWSLPSSLKLDRRCWSNPSDILAPSHTDASASFRQFSSHDPSTSTHTDCSPSLHRFKPQQPFGFHFNRWPFAFPSNFFFFFLTTSSMRLLKLYLFIAFLFWFLS